MVHFQNANSLSRKKESLDFEGSRRPPDRGLVATLMNNMFFLSDFHRLTDGANNKTLRRSAAEASRHRISFAEGSQILHTREAEDKSLIAISRSTALRISETARAMCINVRKRPASPLSA